MAFVSKQEKKKKIPTQQEKEKQYETYGEEAAFFVI